jgi:hypothetical protein
MIHLMIPIPVNVIESDAIIWRQIQATNTIVAKIRANKNDVHAKLCP